MRKHPRSPFGERLEALIERWSPHLPRELRMQFRDEVRPFGDEFDSTLDTIEDIWRRREREYAIDESTGLARRRAFLQHLVALLEMPETPLVGAIGVLFIDVDQLKRINDTFGHGTGDRAVAAAGAIIRDTLRVDRNIDFLARTRVDDEDYSVSRHGGDEFLVALELRYPGDIDVVATRIKQNVDDPEKQRAHGYDAPSPLTVSLGGVVYELGAAPPPFPPHALARELVSAADQQMYDSKRDGRVHLVAARMADKLDVDREHVRVLS